MKKFKFLTFAMCLALLVSCNNTQKGALIGTGGGALLGAVVGKLAGNTAVGTAVGSAVGAGAGALIGKKMDKAKERAEAIDNAKVEEITDANGLKAVKVSFDSGILFNTGRADLQPSARQARFCRHRRLNPGLHRQPGMARIFRFAELPEEQGPLPAARTERLQLSHEPGCKVQPDKVVRGLRRGEPRCKQQHGIRQGPEPPRRDLHVRERGDD